MSLTSNACSAPQCSDSASGSLTAICVRGRSAGHDAAGRCRQQAGTRRATLLSVEATVVARLEELNLPAKQAQVLRKLAAVGKPILSAELMATVPCTVGPITALRRKGLIRSDVTRVRQDGLKHVAAHEEDHQMNEDQLALSAILAHRVGPPTNHRAARHYRQRQDRSLHSRIQE